MKQELTDREGFKREIMETCPIPLEQLMLHMIDRAVMKDEKIFAKYLRIEPFEIKEIGLKAQQYTYFLVTDHNFVIMFVCQDKYWYKVCALRNFKTLQEHYSPPKIINGQNIESFMADQFPGKLRVEIYFDVNDKDLKQVILETDEVRKSIKIKDFILAFRNALSSLNQ